MKSLLQLTTVLGLALLATSPPGVQAAQPPPDAQAPVSPAPSPADPQQTPAPPPAPPTFQPGQLGPGRTQGLIVPVPEAQFAELRFSNRHIVTFRVSIVPLDPRARAESALRTLSRFADDNVSGPVSFRTLLGGNVVTVAGQDVFGIVPADVDPAGGDLEQVTTRVVEQLGVALAEAAEARQPARLVRGFGFTLLATVLLAALLYALFHARRWITERLLLSTSDRLARSRLAGDVSFLYALRLPQLVRALVGLAAWLIGAVAVYSWLSYALQRFPLTRPWGETLGAFLALRLTTLGLGAIASIPGLFTAALIFLAARFITRLNGLVFASVEQGRFTLFGIDAPKAAPTRRLVNVLIWAFAVVVAYPYLPGSNTDAFKGVSVFLGLVVSLGSSGMMNHVMSGFMLTYSGALARGDFARIGDVEGIVTGLGVLATKVKTKRNEEVTIPNAVVISGITTNYTRYAEEGVYAPTVVTIGYDTPWRQVEAMLKLAATRTHGLKADRPAIVLQTGLSDFYVEYTCLVCLAHPAQKPAVLNTLHANIQDVFNEHGVQIMSPHYEADPGQPKVVPQDQWHALPAEPEPAPAKPVPAAAEATPPVGAA